MQNKSTEVPAASDERTILFSDTTLRDGEQAPGIAFSRQKRIAIAKALDELGIDEIEIGFAASGLDHQRDMASVMELGLKARLRSLARPVESDIQAAVDVGVPAVCLFLAFSDFHLKHKLRQNFDSALELMYRAVSFAREKGLYISVAFEDATRTPDERIAKVVERLSPLEFNQISVADTVGIGTPQLIRQKIGLLVQMTDKLVGVHCHDDFGYAVANTIAGVEAGAGLVSTTFNGIGERAGNASTQCCAAALAVLFQYKINLDLSRLISVSNLVAECSGIPLPPNSPVAGANAFRHESGIHVSAMLREPRCYEAVDPAVFGARRQFVLGKTSGRAGVRHFAALENIELSDAMCDDILREIKHMCDSNLTLQEADVRRLVHEACDANATSEIGKAHHTEGTTRANKAS